MPAPAPRLQLLIEWESRRRVFFENLKDLLFSRELPPLHLTSRPARFWNDVFVPTGRPWTSFMESMLWHVLLLVLFVWGQSRVWTPVKTFQDRNSYHQSVVYYPPTDSYRASESRAANIKPHSRVKHEAAQTAPRQAPLPVTPEHKPSIVTPPDIKQATARIPDLPASHPVAPMSPLPNAGPRRNTLSATSVAPPAPQVDEAKLDPSATHRLALPQPPAISPAPNLGLATARSMNMPAPAGQRIVPPPPSIQSAGNAGKSGRLNSLSGRGPEVVPPSPSVQIASDSAHARLGSAAGGDSQVVAPPPSIRGTAAASETGRYSSLSAGGPNIVPPSPSIQGTGNSRSSRLGTLADGSSQVVTPAPSVQGAADSIRTGHSNSLIGGGNSVVPPSPSVSGFGDGARNARAGTRAGIGSQVVPPPASVQGSQGAASMVRSLSGAGSEVVPPPPSVEGGGNAGPGTHVAALSGGDGSGIAPPQQTGQAAIRSGITGPLQPMEPLPEVAAKPAPPAPIEDKSTIEELPLGFLGLVLAAPGTSYFSNFEVFVAKRRVAKGQLELIKLVYQFLPYQKRLSEYDLNNLPARVIKLRVIPDPSCNEALGEIIQPSPDPARPVTEYPKLPAVLSSADVNQVLQCYRTNADDFQKAMLGKR
jgi:hypothetical protein